MKRELHEARECGGNPGECQRTPGILPQQLPAPAEANYEPSEGHPLGDTADGGSGGPLGQPSHQT